MPGRHRAVRSRILGSSLAAAITVLALCATGPAPASAACEVDQSNIATPTTNLAAVFSTQRFGQTFTVGRAGTLCAVAMYVDRRGTPTADLVAEVQGVSAGLPNGTVLATASLPAASVIDGLNVFDVSAAGLAVGIGDVYAIVLRSTASLANDYLAREVPGNFYGSGGAVLDNGTGWAVFGTPAQGFDAIFQTSVDADVSDPIGQIESTVALVESLGLPHGTGTSLLAKLNAAADLLSQDDAAGACEELTAVLNAVRAQRGKKIPTSQADDLSGAATTIRTTLGCS
jgi:hypothetical protein